MTVSQEYAMAGVLAGLADARSWMPRYANQ